MHFPLWRSVIRVFFGRKVQLLEFTIDFSFFFYFLLMDMDMGSTKYDIIRVSIDPVGLEM